MKLDDRKKKILSSVVEDYIVSAEPVGSKTIVDKYHLEYSSATIRNEMKALEENGFLEQPHISAGRIPSTKGYRYYVDNLMKDEKLSMVDINYIDNSITGFGDTQLLLKQAADVVSKILLRPTILTLKTEDVLENIKVLKISDKLLLVVLMSKNGTVKDCIAKLTDTLPEDIINELTTILSKNLVGTPLEQLNIALNRVIAKELNTFSFALGQICESIRCEMSKNEKKLSSNIYSILDLPEFANVEKAKNFVNMLSTKDIIDTTIEKVQNGNLGIIIGSESQEIMLKDYSIISLDIETNNNKIGKIAVVSPKRIDYSKTISTLKYINSKFKNLFLSDKTNKEGGKNE
ncbi:MAG: heat-inducible transcriptional repressor HrcA [Clostridia bacterium]